MEQVEVVDHIMPMVMQDGVGVLPVFHHLVMDLMVPVAVVVWAVTIILLVEVEQDTNMLAVAAVVDVIMVLLVMVAMAEHKKLTHLVAMLEHLVEVVVVMMALIPLQLVLADPLVVKMV